MPTLQSGTLFSLKTLFVGLLLLTTFFLGQANNNDNISGPEDGPETALLNAGNDTYIQSSFMLSSTGNGYQVLRLDDDYVPQFEYKRNYDNKKLTLSSVLNHKFNAKNSVRSGIYFNEYFYDLNLKDRNEETDEVETRLRANSHAVTVQLFSQWSYRMTGKLTLNTGLHYLQLTNNHSQSLEPRASLKVDLDEKQFVSIGYGLHSQVQPIGVYEAEVTDAQGNRTKPNKGIGLNKSHHLVLAYDRAINEFTRVKAETYYQHLFNIAVKDDPASPISTLVIEEGYLTDPLVNKGSGRNYGLELTLEQFFHNNAYFLLSSSWNDSKYKALDGVLRNTRFNGNFAISVTAGKE